MPAGQPKTGRECLLLLLAPEAWALVGPGWEGSRVLLMPGEGAPPAAAHLQGRPAMQHICPGHVVK